MNVFDFLDFRQFLRKHLDNLPKRGHGQLGLWAESLGVSTTLLSQVLKGKKPLSLEHAAALGLELNLARREFDYFLLLVQADRAGSAQLQKHFQAKVTEAQEAARQLKNRIQDTVKLSEEIKALYYSSWIFSGIRNLAVCKDIKTIEHIGEKLSLPRALVTEVLEMLIANALLSESKEGWTAGPNSTYLPSDHPLISKHHQNWRLRSMQIMETPLEENLYYTAPMSLSENMAKKLRKRIVDFIEELHQEAEPTDSETTRCLSLDWFSY